MDPAPPSAAAGQAGEILKQINADYRTVLNMQAQTRRQKDILKLSCINDKLVQIKAEMNIADSASQQLQLASPAGSDHIAAYQQLQQSGNAVRDLRQEAATCLGQMELVNQESGPTVTHPEFPDDPTVIPFSTYVEPPAYASPFN